MEDSIVRALLKKADGLKGKIHQSKNILIDKEAQKSEKDLQETYKSIVLQDLDFALKNNVEEHLWRSGFKVSIDLAREENTEGFLVWSSYGRPPPMSQIVLVKCLRATANFYENLLFEICSTFDFDLPFMRTKVAYVRPLRLAPFTFDSFKFNIGNHLYYKTKPLNVHDDLPRSTPGLKEKGLKKPEKRSLILMSQNCLTHIGDCVRYEMEYEKAHMYFEKALQLNPLSGHCHNQFGLLNSYEGNVLPTLYHYVRAIASPEPYLKARDNMRIFLKERATGDMGKHGPVSLHITSVSTFTTYVHVFVMLMGRLRVGSTPLHLLQRLVKILVRSLRVFAANEIRGGSKMSFDALNQMFAMNVFVLQDTRNGFPPREGERIFESDPEVTRAVVFDLIAGSLDSLLRPLTDVKPGTVLGYGGLPTIRLVLDWIRTEPSVLQEDAFSHRLGIWSRLSTACKSFDEVGSFFRDKEEEVRSVPLPEDRELEGFTVLQPIFSELRFINDLFEEVPKIYRNPAVLRFIRVNRMLKFGTWLCEYATPREDKVVGVRSIERGVAVELDPVFSSVMDAALTYSVGSDFPDVPDSDDDSNDSGSFRNRFVPIPPKHLAFVEMMAGLHAAGAPRSRYTPSSPSSSSPQTSSSASPHIQCTNNGANRPSPEPSQPSGQSRRKRNGRARKRNR